MDRLGFDPNRLKPRKNLLVRHLDLTDLPPQVTDVPPQATDLPSQTIGMAPQAADMPT